MNYDHVHPCGGCGGGGGVGPHPCTDCCGRNIRMSQMERVIFFADALAAATLTGKMDRIDYACDKYKEARNELD